MGRKIGRTTKVVSVSFDRDNYNFLLNQPNRSDFVNDAVREKIMRNKTPEIKIKEIKDRKRELAIQITNLTAEEEKIKEKLR